MIKYLANGIEVNGEFISKETLVKEIESVKVKERDLVLLEMEWEYSRNFDGCYEGIVLPRELANEFIENFSGRRASFGEIAGKHSDINGTLEADEISLNDDVVGFLSRNPSGRRYDHSFVRALFSELEGEDYEKNNDKLFDILERVENFKV